MEDEKDTGLREGAEFILKYNDYEEITNQSLRKWKKIKVGMRRKN